jgi:hypothetical protein
MMGGNMGRMLAALTAVCIACAITSPSAPAAMDGNALLTLCEGPDADIGPCAGYIAGVLDTAEWWALQDGRCVLQRPASAPPKQYVDIVLQALRNHPERRHYPAVMLVNSAMSEAFACSK